MRARTPGKRFVQQPLPGQPAERGLGASYSEVWSVSSMSPPGSTAKATASLPCAPNWISPAKGDTIEDARHNIEEAVAVFFEAASEGEIQERFRREFYVTHLDVAVG